MDATDPPVELVVAESFAVFFEREFHRMVTLAQAVSGDSVDGEDIAAEAMLTASQRWDTVSGYDRPGAWVRRITINLALNRRRRLKLHRAVLERERPTVAAPQPEVRDDALWALVAALPDQQRAAVALRYLDDLATAEIAEILECRESTVSSHLYKARATLAAALDEGRST